MFSRRDFVAAAGSLPTLTLAPAAADASAPLTPEMFGARGDGVTNDTDAFAAMAAEVNRRGGGTVALRKTTYIVGRQFRASGARDWAFRPAVIMAFVNLHLPLIIRGNGARLRCASGLRYGAFDRATGEPINRPLPFYDERFIATPYRAMIHVVRCDASVAIADLELDGNLPGLVIGGPFGDTGHQIPAIGLYLEDNQASEQISNLHSHHHGQDGVEINGVARRSARSVFDGVVTEYNARQGVSVIGGQGYDFLRCKFNHTGRSKIASAPAAGVDIEAENAKTVRDLTFVDCEFVDNVGCGLLAEAGDGEGARFERCRFVGTTSWSAWPRKPNFRFHGCTFVGAAVNAYPSKDPSLATQFHYCKFYDDPQLSPTHEVYPDEEGQPIVNLGESDNVLFDHCLFKLTNKLCVPWSWRATYVDCTMVQRTRHTGYPKGKHLGRTTIVGNVDLYNSKVSGTLIVNGAVVPKGLHGGDPW